MDFQDIFESESGVGLQLNQRGHNESISDDENLDLDSSTSENACVSNEASSEDDIISLSSSNDSDADTEDSDSLFLGGVTSEEDTVAPSDQLITKRGR